MSVHKRTLSLEPLESRQLMHASALLSAEILTIDADPAGGAVDVLLSTDNLLVAFAKSDPASASQSFHAADIQRIIFRGSEASDDFENRTPILSILYGNGGNDVLTGGSYHDLIYGGPGDDYLNSGPGADHIHGGTGNDTLVSIDGETFDELFGDNGNDSFWSDQDDAFTSPAHDAVRDADDYERLHNLHQVAKFANGADKTLDGDDLPDPPDVESYTNFGHRPLFASAGPSEHDIRQGSLKDCWLMAALGATVRTNAGTIMRTIGDLGDGTFAVELGGKHYRVDADLPTNGPSSGHLRYAGLGQEGSIWAPIIEKAYAFHRRRVYAYRTLNGGFASEAFAALGARMVRNVNLNEVDDALTYIAGELEHGRPIVVNIRTPTEGCPCLASHIYIVESVNYISDVADSVVLRNPWGVDGSGNDGANDGLVTVTGGQLVASMYAELAMQSAWI